MKITKKNMLIFFSIASWINISACSTVNPEKSSSKTNEAPHVTIAMENPESSPAPHLTTTMETAHDSAKPITDTSPATRQISKIANNRINPNEPFVNVRTAPSIKSRNIAVIMGGQAFEILETTDAWLKIKWKQGNVEKQGWLKKRFVEGYDQNQ